MEISMHSQLCFQKNEASLGIAGAGKYWLCQTRSALPMFRLQFCHGRRHGEPRVHGLQDKSHFHF